MVLTVDQLNRHVIEMKYDVRGELYLAAEKRVREGKEVIFTNVIIFSFYSSKTISFDVLFS